MYLSTITLKNFRKYAYDGANKHGITVNFHKGLNALIGENDSGKSAINTSHSCNLGLHVYSFLLSFQMVIDAQSRICHTYQWLH